MSETHLTDVIEDCEINIANYTCVRCDSSSRHTGGVAVYVRRSIQFSVYHCEVFNNNNTWFLAIKTTSNFKKGIYAVLYHSPSTSDLEFLDYLDNIFENILNENDLNLITGDFNINMLNNNTNAKRLKSIINLSGMKQLIKEPTRITPNSSTLIDLAITNIFNLNVKVSSLLQISDHCTVTINFKTKPKPSKELVQKSFIKYNKTAFQCELNQKLNVHNINQSDFLVDLIKTSIETMRVNKTVKINYDNQWYTSALSDLQKEQYQAYKQFISSKSVLDWAIYISKRNEYNSEITKTKNNFIQSELNKHLKNSKQLWKTLKSLIKNPSKSKAEFITFTNEKFCDSTIIAEKFNNYFVSSIEAINSSIKLPPNHSGVLINQVESIFKFEKINLLTLISTIKNMNQTTDPDNIQTNMLLDAMEVLGESFVSLINCSFETGIFPHNWKTTTVVPVPKIPGSRRCEDHRPINMLPNHEKALESIVKNQLKTYTNSNNIISEKQSGFRSQHSCETTLNLVLVEWKKSLEECQYIVATFLDFQRAFETIDRSRLLLKLGKYGIQGTELNWFKTYLTDRYQITTYDKSNSTAIENNLGVPQGSILGPDLFNLYINDLPDVITSSSIAIFADDTLIWSVNKDLATAINNLNADLEEVSMWLKSNKMMLNINKTKAMIITKKNKNVFHPDVTIDGNSIEIVDSFKYLGFIIDHNLNWKENTEFVVKKVTKKINFLNRIKRKLPFNLRVSLYHSIIAPHFEYCSSVLFLINISDMKVLQRLQNRAMRVILNCDKYTRINDMLQTLQWHSVKQRIHFNTLLFIFKLKFNMLPQYLVRNLHLVGSLHRFNTRSSKNYSLSKMTKCNTQNSLFYKGIKLYNEMNDDIKNETNIYRFKSKLSDYCKLKF